MTDTPRPTAIRDARLAIDLLREAGLNSMDRHAVAATVGFHLAAIGDDTPEIDLVAHLVEMAADERIDHLRADLADAALMVMKRVA